MTAPDRTHPLGRPQRFRARVRVLFRRAGATRFLEGETTNVSRGGLFLEVHRPLPVGSRIGLVLHLDPDPPLALRGTVAWVTPAEVGSPGRDSPGMGIRFEEVDAQGRERLDGLLRRLEAEAG
jgi:uncharacterized protein (TIGR02266 family)